MVCQKCGKIVPAGMSFCGMCGTPLGPAAAASSQPGRGARIGNGSPAGRRIHPAVLAGAVAAAILLVILIGIGLRPSSSALAFRPDQANEGSPEPPDNHAGPLTGPTETPTPRALPPTVTPTPTAAPAAATPTPFPAAMAAEAADLTPQPPSETPGSQDFLALQPPGATPTPFPWEEPVPETDAGKTVLAGDSHFYYDQLPTESQELYRAVSEGTAALIAGREHLIYQADHELSQEEVDALCGLIENVMGAFHFDHPLSAMYIKAYSYTWLNGTDGFYLTIKTNEDDEGLDTAEERVEKIREVEEAAASFVGTLAGSDREKLKAIHDYLTAGSRYDHDAGAPCYDKIYGAMINHYAVCEGYAESFKYLCDLASLPCIYVSNTAPSVDHSWNYVYVDGAWQGVDVTWDLPEPDGWGGDHWFLFPVTDSGHPQYGDYGFRVLP